MLRKIPSDTLDSFNASELSSQSHAPDLIPAVSTCPGQLPTLKWKPVFSSGPAGDDTNSTNIYCEVPKIPNQNEHYPNDQFNRNIIFKVTPTNGKFTYQLY